MMLYIMERMLYTVVTMDNKPNLPDELAPGKKEYSGRADLKVNGWAYLGMILSLAGDVLLHCCKDSKDWPVAARGIIALAPLPPFMLWIPGFARWLRGMDELDRQITIKVCLFATTATLYLFMALHPLSKWGVSAGGWWLLDWRSWWLQGWLMTCFYILGTRIFNRRYK
jgi:hypothetical protein